MGTQPPDQPPSGTGDPGVGPGGPGLDETGAAKGATGPRAHPPGGMGAAGGGWQGAPPGRTGDVATPPAGSRRQLWIAVGVVVVILAAVIVFLLQKGDGSRGGEPQGAGLTTSMSAGATAGVKNAGGRFPASRDQRFLLAHVPANIEGSCRPERRGLVPRGATAGIRCVTRSRADYVSYYRYPTKRALERRYNLSLFIAGASPDTGDCPFHLPAERSYVREGGDPIGRYVCFRTGGQGRIEWTNNELLIYAEAVRLKGPSQSLEDFWTDAGPVSTGD